MAPSKKTKATTATPGSSTSRSGNSGGGGGSSTTTTIASPKTLLDLPESLHIVIARFLKRSEVLAVTTTCARLQGWCVCEELRLFSHTDLHGSTLAKLLRRFPRVVKLSVRSNKVIIPLAMAISMGTCKNLRELVFGSMDKVSAQVLEALGTAIEAGAMPVLQKFTIDGVFQAGGAQSLLCGFCEGACPLLNTLDFPFFNPSCKYDSGEDEDEDEDEIREPELEALAVMLEKRKGLGETVRGWSCQRVRWNGLLTISKSDFCAPLWLLLRI